MSNKNLPQYNQNPPQNQQLRMAGLTPGLQGGGGGTPPAPPPQPKVVDKDLFKRTVSYVKSNLVIVFLFSFVINILNLTPTMYLWQISDRVLVSRSLETLILLTVIAAGALLLLAILDYLRKMTTSRIGSYIGSNLGEVTFRASLDPARTKTPDGQLTQPLRDLDQVRGFLSSPVMIFLFDLPSVFIYIGIVFLIHVWLGWVLTIGAVILFAFALLNKRLTANLQKEASEHANAAFSRAQAQVQNAHIVNSMGMQSAGVRLWGKESRNAIITQLKSGNRGAIIAALSSLVRMLIQVTILGLGAYLTLDNKLSAGSAIAASIIGARGLAPIQGTIEGWKNFVLFLDAYGRVTETVTNFLAKQTERIALPKPKGNLAVESVSLQVPTKDRPLTLLRNINFQINQGESLAIIGPSGGGKSTLARLIVGAMHPTVGAVRLDGTSLKNWDPEQFGSHIGYLPQDVELFPGTIKANISRFQEDIPDEAIISASKITGTHDLVSKLPDGYETMLGQNGAPLSGGQKQRVALARAFFGKPSMIVLDEPNANLDNVGEKFLARAILAAKKHGITIVMVTQRKEITQMGGNDGGSAGRSRTAVVDKMIVVSNGVQAAFGTRDEVLAKLAEASAPSKK